MSRQMMNKAVDKKVFRRTARTTKTVNLGRMVMRGGIRF